MDDENEEVEYVNSDGYLVDETGELILDEDGNPILADMSEDYEEEETGEAPAEEQEQEEETPAEPAEGDAAPEENPSPEEN